MVFLSHIVHMFSAKACLKHALDESAWHGKELRCPVCHRLIAYVYPSHGFYKMHITYRYLEYDLVIYASSPQWVDEPVPNDDPVTINWDLLRPPVEPLMSDTWDSDAAYQACVQEHIQQLHQLEEASQNNASSSSNTGAIN